MTPIEALPYATLIAIAAMAGATALMRLGGFWLMGQVTITPRVRRMLEALPGSVVVAIVLPIVVKEGAPALIAVAAVIGMMLIRRNEFLALGIGLAAAIAARAAGL